mmetsp:Transcript_46365/g.154723  ORF Transcript_46365/g.154723 Transcript_46365/m.154723 type:complete len:240 (+) Transcript_46365:774-1493(+)
MAERSASSGRPRSCGCTACRTMRSRERGASPRAYTSEWRTPTARAARLEPVGAAASNRSCACTTHAASGSMAARGWSVSSEVSRASASSRKPSGASGASANSTSAGRARCRQGRCRPCRCRLKWRGPASPSLRLSAPRSRSAAAPHSWPAECSAWSARSSGGSSRGRYDWKSAPPPALATSATSVPLHKPARSAPPPPPTPPPPPASAPPPPAPPGMPSAAWPTWPLKDCLSSHKLPRK